MATSCTSGRTNRSRQHRLALVLSPGALGPACLSLIVCQTRKCNLSGAELTMKTPLLSGETLIKDGAAKLQRGIKTVGGRLPIQPPPIPRGPPWHLAIGPPSVARTPLLASGSPGIDAAARFRFSHVAPSHK